MLDNYIVLRHGVVKECPKGMHTGRISHGDKNIALDDIVLKVQSSHMSCADGIGT